MTGSPRRLTWKLGDGDARDAQRPITIPKRIRDYLGIEPGSMVEFDVTPDGRIVLINQEAAPKPSRFEEFRGTATTKLTTDELMANAARRGLKCRWSTRTS